MLGQFGWLDIDGTGLDLFARAIYFAKRTAMVLFGLLLFAVLQGNQQLPRRPKKGGPCPNFRDVIAGI